MFGLVKANHSLDCARFHKIPGLLPTLMSFVIVAKAAPHLVFIIYTLMNGHRPVNCGALRNNARYVE
jgi:hypothetical protein